MQGNEERWQFGPFEVDRRRRLLLARGKPVKLDAKAFELLDYLVCHRDEAPARDEILAHVWRGMTVSENNLSVQLSALRRALLDNGGGDKLILTLPGRRYRFVGDVTSRDDTPTHPQPPLAPVAPPAPDAVGARLAMRRAPRAQAGVAFFAALLVVIALWRILTGRGEVAAGGVTLSIMVLPFRNLSDKAEARGSAPGPRCGLKPQTPKFLRKGFQRLAFDGVKGQSPLPCILT